MIVLANTTSNVSGADLHRLQQLSQEADWQARESVFDRYRMTRARTTTHQQLRNMRVFSRFLWEVAHLEIDADTFYNSPEIWSAVSGGLVQDFQLWLIDQGYSIGSINQHVGTLRTYAELAFQAGHLEHTEYLYIQSIHGFSQTEGRRIDAYRSTTRIGRKKAESVPLTTEQVRQLKSLQGHNPKHFRDRLLMCLALNHSLRASELVSLTFGSVDTETMLMRWHRQKTSTDSTHRLKEDTAEALLAYTAQLGFEPTGSTPLLLSCTRAGKILRSPVKGMTTRAVYKVVNQLGEQIGISNLGAHDMRHAWATEAARNGTQLDILMAAGGWTSYQMPLRYIQKNQIDNEGIKLSW